MKTFDNIAIILIVKKNNLPTKVLLEARLIAQANKQVSSSHRDIASHSSVTAAFSGLFLCQHFQLSFVSLYPSFPLSLPTSLLSSHFFLPSEDPEQSVRSQWTQCSYWHKLTLSFGSFKVCTLQVQRVVDTEHKQRKQGYQHHSRLLVGVWTSRNF